MTAQTFTAKELAARFRVDVSAIYAYARQKILPIEKDGTAFRFTAQDLQDFAASDEPLMTAQEVADRLKIGLVAFHGMRARRAIPFIKLSRVRYRFRWSEVHAALTQTRVRPMLPAPTFRVENCNKASRPTLKFRVRRTDGQSEEKYFASEGEAITYAAKRNRGVGKRAIAALPDLWRDASPDAPAWRVRVYLPSKTKEENQAKFYAYTNVKKKPVKRFFKTENDALEFANEQNSQIAAERFRRKQTGERMDSESAPAEPAAPVVWRWDAPANQIEPATLAGVVTGKAAPADVPELTSALTVAARLSGESMATFTVHPYKHASCPWVVNGSANGKRKRKFFQSEGEARTYAHLQNTELLNKGREAMDFPSWLRTMAQRCHELLEPSGATIEDAVRHYLAAKAREAQSITLKECIEHLVQTRVSEAVSRRYVIILRTGLQRFAEAIGPQVRVSEITTREIDGYLSGMRGVKDSSQMAGAPTRKQARRMLATLFSYAKTHRYCVENPVNGAMRVKLAETEVGIFRPEEIAALLTHAPVEFVPFLAIGAFAGLRVAELLRLDWRDVKLDRNCIEVPAKKAKSARRRIVKVHPCLDAWIRPLAKLEGKIVPVEHFAPHEMLAGAIAAAKLPAWVRNGLRHSFASYHIAKWNDAAKLALEMGHTTTLLIFAHYRAVVHESDAEKYWNIFPVGTVETETVANFPGGTPRRDVRRAVAE